MEGGEKPAGHDGPGEGASLEKGEEEVEEPREGMTFRSEEEVRSYYLRYAAKVGFGIRRSCTKSGDDGKLKYFSFSCSRSRKPPLTSRNSFPLRPSTRTDCKAKINLVVGNDGSLFVSKVSLEHNHALTPGRPQYVRCNRRLKGVVLPQIQDGEDRASAGDNALNSAEDMKTVSLSLRAGDADAIQRYFVRMQEKNANPFYVMDLNEEGHLRNVFWADLRSRAAYEEFGDVLILDTTYLANKYDTPFVAFFGVNHHGQHTLLGCSLLSNEDAETYTWLFKSLLICMSGQRPQAIMTNLSESIQAAVSKVFPNSRHRLCLSHIMRKNHEMLEGIAQCQTIKKAIKCVIYESQRPSAFDENWGEMIQEYNLANNQWLTYLYAERHRWVPAFVRQFFWAGLNLNQCCEIMNAFFDGYINSKTGLKLFLDQLDSVLKSKIEKEKKADVASFAMTTPLFSDLHIEKQFYDAYTQEAFKVFQEELKGLLYCNTSFVKYDEHIFTYEVIDSVKVKDGAPRKETSYEVIYDEVDGGVQCLCHLFEGRGILCRHVIAVLIKRNVHEIPSRYILSRWRKDIKRKHSFLKASYYNFEADPQVQRYDHLCSSVKQIAQLGAESYEKCKALTEYLDELKEKLLRDECWISLSQGRLPPEKRKDVSVDEISNKKKKKTFKGRLGQSVDGDNSHLTNEIVTHGSQVISEDNSTHAWTVNTGIVTNTSSLLEGHLEDMGFTKYGTHGHSYKSGQFLQDMG